jgi:hypothetical protein
MGLFAPVAFVQTLYDPDARAFFAATGIQNAGLKVAVNNLVKSLKDAGLWTAMRQICPLVADDSARLAAQFAVNLKTPGTYNLTFPNGVAGSNLSGFLAVEASTIYANTNLAPRTVFGSLGNYSVGIYTTTSGETGDAWDWGGFTANNNYSYFIIGRSLSGGNAQAISALRPDNIASVTATAANGFYNGRFNTGLSPIGRFTRNGTQIGSSNGGSGDIFNANAFFGSANFSGVPTSKCDKRYQMLMVSTGLTDAQMTSLNTIVQNFQSSVDNALGTSRKV